MNRCYCDRCGKEITYYEDRKARILDSEKRSINIFNKCKYSVSTVEKIVGLIDDFYSTPGEDITVKRLDLAFIDLCDDCRIALNEMVGVFMDGTPVPTST